MQAFCGAGSAGRALTLKLRGLDPALEYTVTDWDNPAESRTLSGADLANGGITLIAESSPRAVVLRFKSR